MSAKTVKPKSKLHWSFDVDVHFTLRIKKRGFLISRGGLNTPYFTMKSKYCLNFLCGIIIVQQHDTTLQANHYTFKQKHHTHTHFAHYVHIILFINFKESYAAFHVIKTEKLIASCFKVQFTQLE